MIMLWVSIGVALLFFGVLWGLYLFKKKDEADDFFPPSTQVLPPTPMILNMEPILHAIEALPNKILQSVQSSANGYKGSVGELIGYLKLHAAYDRIIPLNNIVDFICIRFPKGEDPGCIDFIDVKTGEKARLSPDQKMLQKLIKGQHINFIKMKIQATTAEDYEDPS
jgi:hypothetical protein